MASLFPREEHAEALFHRILSNPGAEQQLYETFCMEQENASFEDGGGAECSFAKALLQAYENRDISALTIALCQQLLDGHGAVHVHGGGFAGTALAFVPNNRFEQFKDKIDAAIGVNAVHKLIIQ